MYATSTGKLAWAVQGAVVIFDEAHNIEDTAREAASCDVTLSHLVVRFNSAEGALFLRTPGSQKILRMQSIALLPCTFQQIIYNLSSSIAPHKHTS